MTVTFLKCLSEPRAVYKTFDNAEGSSHTVTNAAIYQACSIMYPEIVVNYSPLIAKCNYLTTYEGVFGNRCYFIKEQIVLPGGRILVRCAIDVLYTWRDYISSCTANIIRQESSQNTLLVDTCMQQNSKTSVYAHDFNDNQFSSQPSGQCYMLTVIGGAHTTEPEPENRGDSND